MACSNDQNCFIQSEPYFTKTVKFQIQSALLCVHKFFFFFTQPQTKLFYDHKALHYYKTLCVICIKYNNVFIRLCMMIHNYPLKNVKVIGNV
jgi:hypothetical protein